MAEKKSMSNSPLDYKERFEFELTVGGNIICQRYFKINNFNPACLRSYELTSCVRQCAMTINNDIKDKTQTYLEMYAPQIFDTVEEMEKFFANPANKERMSLGRGIVVRNNKDTDYFWSDNETPKELGSKFDDGELTDADSETAKCDYRFAFKVDGREVCTTTWEGYYPKFVRDKIDLSNKRGKFDGEDITRLSFEQYLLYKMVEGKSDLVWGLIKSICYACSFADKAAYTTKPEDILAAWSEDSTRFLFRL